jgi:outer membrane biosynthesis protein TonB
MKKILINLLIAVFLIENAILFWGYFFTSWFDVKFIQLEKPVVLEKTVEIEKPVYVQHPADTPVGQPTPTPVVKPEPTPSPLQRIVIKQPTPIPQSECTDGVINGKAIDLVKPDYPEEAKLKKLNVQVKVAVVIEKDGTVNFAKADSKYSFFNSAAEKAALSSIFSPTFLNCQPVKVTGVIVYNFTAQ